MPAHRRRCPARLLRVVRGLGTAVLGLAAWCSAAAETWTLVEVRPVAPGHGATTPPWPLGTRWRLDAQGLHGPAPLSCSQARQTLLRVPAQGLFQGLWQSEGPTAAQAKARALGFTQPLTATLRLDCTNASFDLHRLAADQMLLVVDGQVLRLRVQPEASDTQAPVRQVLLQHNAEDGAFDRARLARLRTGLAPALYGAFEQWFARPARPDEAPYLDGDPFTDTQEPPLGLTLGALELRGAPTPKKAGAGRAIRATQTVIVALEGGRQHRLRYHLQWQSPWGWQVADIDYGHDTTLRQLLRRDTAR